VCSFLCSADMFTAGGAVGSRMSTVLSRAMPARKRSGEERKEKKCDVLRILSVVSLAASTPSLFFARDLSLGQQTGQSVKVVAGIVFDLQAAALSLLDDPDLGVQLVGQLVGQGGTV
jgi:hypothetical protein